MDFVPEINQPPFILDLMNFLSIRASLTWGRAFRYGISLQQYHKNPRKGLVHELVYTMQYERLNGFDGFLRQYLGDYLSIERYEFRGKVAKMSAAERNWGISDGSKFPAS
ncbi:MAG TPA: hypothetical protein VH619_01745 [Verrucomicrobiae bacterium]|nr:hypothetical protein [Verrucomicrobiae bacterium]